MSPRAMSVWRLAGDRGHLRPGDTHAADLTHHRLRARVVGGVPDHHAAAVAGAPDADPLDVDVRLADQEVERVREVGGPGQRIDHLAHEADLYGRFLGGGEIGHAVGQDHRPFALAPGAVAPVQRDVAGGGELGGGAARRALGAAPAVGERDRRELLVGLQALGQEHVAVEAVAVAPDHDLAHLDVRGRLERWRWLRRGRALRRGRGLLRRG